VIDRGHLKAIIWALAGRGTTITAGLAVTILAARLLGQASYGHFLICLTLITVAGATCPLGVNATAVRNLTAVTGAERRRESLSMAATIIAAAVIGSIAWLLLALGPGREAIYRLVGAGTDLLLVTAVALSAAGFGLQLTLSEILRAAGRIGAASFSGGALYGLAFAIALACVAVGAGGAKLDQVLVIQASIMACAVAACLPLVAKALGGFPRDVAWRRLPGLVWESLPGGLLYPAFNLMVQMDLLALSFFRPAELAVYGAANRLVLLLTVPGVVLEAALAQPYARHLHAGNRAMLQSLVSEAASIATLGAIPIVVVYVFAGGWLTAHLFGPEFAASGQFLAILSFGFLAAALVGPGMLLLILGGRQRLALAVLCGCMIPYAALLGLAARYSGAHAVALTVVAGVWGIFLALAFTVRKCLGIWIFATPSAAWGLLKRSAGVVGRRIIRA
jgi:O-antigen/teichoic acid export membrane protein